MADRLCLLNKRRQYQTRRDYGGIPTWFQCPPTAPPPRNCLKEKNWAISIAVQHSYPTGQSSYSLASASAAASESPIFPMATAAARQGCSLGRQAVPNRI